MIVRVRGFVGTAHGARTARRFVVAALVAFALVLQALPGISGTTGSLNGVLHDAAGKPISGATVTASSPSQRSKTTTDGHGNWGFASLAPDTYTVTFEKAGYATSSQPGVTIQADNSLVLNGELSPSNLQTIGRAASRSSGSLLRPGQTASLYSVSSSEATAAAALGGGGNNNSALSVISSLPGVSVPLTQSGWGQSIFIRGGNYTQTANEVDGVPINRAFDQYPASALSSLGNQEIEVYTGDAPSDSQATGLAGLVNQVIKTGTYPGTLSGDYGVGTPSQYHHFNVEVSGATQNGNLSWYLASGGYQQDTRVVSQFNGAGFLQATGNGSIYNYVSANCGTANPTVGCYQNASPFLGGIPFGPNGYSIADVLFGGEPSTYDRETIANLHFGIPHKDGTKDDVQYLYDYGLARNYPNSSFASWGPALSDVENGTANGVPYLGTCGAPGPATTCDGPVQPTYIDANQYTGKLGVPFTANEVGNAVNLKFPGQLVSGLGANVPDTQYDGEISEFAINKFQYQHNIGTQGYVRAYAYTMYSNRIDNGIVGLWQTYVGSFSSDYAIQSHTSGYVVNGGFQIDPKNFVKFDAGYTTSNAYRLNNLTDAGSGETQVAYLVNSLNPTSGCYSGTGAYVSCSSGQAGYVLAPVNALTGGCGQALCLTKGSPVAGTESSITCGTGPCQYYAVNSGLNASYNTVTPKFLNASIGDQWKPIPQLTVDATLRTDTFSYVMQDTDTFGNQLFVNDYNALHCISGTTITTIAYGASCPAGSSPTNLSAISPNLTFANYLQPRFGISWQKDPNDVFRVSYGRFVQPPDTAAVQATNVQASVPSTSFYSEFGFNSFARTVVPEISYNLDASWQHGFGGGITTVVTPFLRKTQDEFASIVVDPKTNFVADVNGENLDARGIEFALNKGDFDKNGLALRASFTYTYATAQFKQYATGGSFVSDINTQIVNYNKYTSYCGSNPSSKLCNDPNASSIVASACYLNGSPAACSTAGAVANPYYDASPQGLFDPGASYVPYNGSIAAGSAGTSTSYVTPYVGSLVMQWKRNRFKVTPSAQVYAGARYGTPFSSFGVAPDTCSALAGTSPATDPRYAGTGLTAGSGYDASTCTGYIQTPDPATGKFDGVGQFVQPTLVDVNLQLSYDITKSITLQLTGANLVATCFGGSNVPWAVSGRNGCAYSAAQSAGNFYNPGDTIQPGFRYAYGPDLAGTLQSLAQQAVNPVELFIELKFHDF